MRPPCWDPDIRAYCTKAQCSGLPLMPHRESLKTRISEFGAVCARAAQRMAQPGKGVRSRCRTDPRTQGGTHSLSTMDAIARSQMLRDRRCWFTNRDEALHRIRSDYFELPGLRLTCAQAARLWGLRLDDAAALLEELQVRGFLARIEDQYCRR